MTFAYPIGLLGLAGILIPLAIHLLSRKEGKVIRIGSLRHLEETSTRQFKSIKLNEVLLLVLRSLLIAWVVLWISGAQWPGAGARQARWLLVEPGLEQDASLARLTDSLKDQGFEIRALTDGFPLLKDSVATQPKDYWALVETLRQKPLGNVVIYSANRAQAFRGRRVALPGHFRWISAPLPGEKFILATIQTGKDSAWVRTGYAAAGSTAYNTHKLALHEINDTLTDTDTLRIALAIAPAYAYDGKIMAASLKTIAQSVPEPIKIISTDGVSLPAKLDWVIWLRDEPLPPTTAMSLILNTQSPGKLLQQKENGKWVLSRRLLPDLAVRENLTLALTNLLTPHPALWQKAAGMDRRMADDTQAVRLANTTNHTAWPTGPHTTLWVVLATITLLAERLVAYRRKQ